MARLSKFCPTCKRNQPIELSLVPASPTVPTTSVAWRVKCLVCSTEIPSEFAGTTVADGKAWVAANRDAVRQVADRELEAKGD